MPKHDFFDFSRFLAKNRYFTPNFGGYFESAGTLNFDIQNAEKISFQDLVYRPLTHNRLANLTDGQKIDFSLKIWSQFDPKLRPFSQF